MKTSQKIRNIETFTPFSAIREALFECVENRKTIDETASFIHNSLFGLMASNEADITIEFSSATTLDSELRFKEKQKE